MTTTADDYPDEWKPPADRPPPTNDDPSWWPAFKAGHLRSGVQTEPRDQDPRYPTEWLP